LLRPRLARSSLIFSAPCQGPLSFLFQTFLLISFGFPRPHTNCGQWSRSVPLCSAPKERPMPLRPDPPFRHGSFSFDWLQGTLPLLLSPPLSKSLFLTCVHFFFSMAPFLLEVSPLATLFLTPTIPWSLPGSPLAESKSFYVCCFMFLCSLFSPSYARRVSNPPFSLLLEIHLPPLTTPL